MDAIGSATKTGPRAGVAGFVQGAGYVVRGFAMWKRRPGLMLLGMVPAAIVLLVVGAALVVLLVNLGDVVGGLTGFADDWSETPRTLLRLGVGVLLVLGSFFLASVTFTGLTLALGDPFYERIWRETEAMLGGPVPQGAVGFWRSLRDGLAVAVLGALAGLAVAVIALVPLVGTVVGAVLGLVVAGRLLAVELLARPLEPRGYDRQARRPLLRAHRAPVLGLGVLTQAFFLVPLGAVVVMPAAVVGATMLARDLLPDER